MDANMYAISFAKKKQTSSISIVIACTLAFIVIMAGCGDSVTDADNDANGDGNGTQAPNEVSMDGNSFVPGNLTVEVGATVVWTNNSNVVHTVTSGTNGNHDGVFDSGNVAAGEQYSYTFTEIGTYPYYCIPHVNQGMTGTIIVEASGD